MGNRSGAARRRRRRLAEMQGRYDGLAMRLRDAQDCIGNGKTALEGIRILACKNDGALEITGDEIASLLGLVLGEISEGLDLLRQP